MRILVQANFPHWQNFNVYFNPFGGVHLETNLMAVYTFDFKKKKKKLLEFHNYYTTIHYLQWGVYH